MSDIKVVISGNEKTTLKADVKSPSTGGTSNYLDLTNKPKINGVELAGDLTTADLGIEVDIDTSNLVTKDELENKGYLTEHQDISGLATKNEVQSVEDKIPDVSEFVTKNEIPTVPTKVSELENDSLYMTQQEITQVMQIVADQLQGLNTKVGNIDTLLDDINGEII